jgi:DNA recombination protein RmuC
MSDPLLTVPLLILVLAALIWLAIEVRRRSAGSNGSVAEAAALNERVAAREQQIADLQARLAERERDIATLRSAVADLESQVARLTAERRKDQEAMAEKVALLAEARERLSDAFKALSLDALRGNSEAFLKLANSTLERFQEAARGDLERRQQAIGEMVRPVKDSLAKFEDKISEIERSRAGAYEGLREQVRSMSDAQQLLRQETSNLVRALRAPQVRGRWGEITLKRVVEMAGMLDHCDFFEQVSAESEEGRLRPDLIVRLPGGRSIVVDSKVPLEAYLRSLEAADDNERKTALREHARQVMDHVRKLGQKAYWSQFQPAPDFVVLFVPGEVFYAAALQEEPSLIEMSVEQGVLLAAPTTLIALLKTVSYGWRQEHLAENARAIGELGQELHKRLADMAEHLADVGSRLDKAVESYNKAVGSMESRVLVSARRFAELEVPAEKEIPGLAPIERRARLPEAPSS